VPIGRCGNLLQVLESSCREQITGEKPQAGSGRNACHNLGIIDIPAEAVK
jgi:hypothetical protein